MLLFYLRIYNYRSTRSPTSGSPWFGRGGFSRVRKKKTENATRIVFNFGGGNHDANSILADGFGYRAYRRRFRLLPNRFNASSTSKFVSPRELGRDHIALASVFDTSTTMTTCIWGDRGGGVVLRVRTSVTLVRRDVNPRGAQLERRKARGEQRQRWLCSSAEYNLT